MKARCITSCFETVASRPPQHEEVLCNPLMILILRSGLQGRVSKDAIRYCSDAEGIHA
jgi:hypothetical protein